MAQTERDKAWESRLRSLGLAIVAVEALAEPGKDRTFVLTELRFKLHADNGTSVLAILKAEGDKGSLVAFVGGFDLSTTLLAVRKKARAGAISWREDRPYGA